MFNDEPEARAAKIKKKALKDAMTRLFAAKRIRIGSSAAHLGKGSASLREAAA